MACPYAVSAVRLLDGLVSSTSSTGASQASYPLGKMKTPERTPRTLGVDAETLRRWRSRGLLRARELQNDQLRPGCEDAAPVVTIGAAPVMVSGSDDLVAVRARPVD